MAIPTAPAATDSWTDANQRVLVAHMTRVKLRVERHLSGEPESDEWVHREREAAAAVATAEAALPSPSALDILSATFGLSPFERDVVLLAAGPDLDSSFATGWERGGDRRGGAAPTFALAMSALASPHWFALTPEGPLRRWHLIELGPGPGATSSPLRIDERILHYLAGIQGLDERLDGIVDAASVSRELPPSQTVAVDSIVGIWTQPEGVLPIIHLCGPDRPARTAVAGAACRSLGIPLHVIRLEALPASAVDTEFVRRLCERETALTGSALLIDCDPGGARPDEISVLPVARFADRFHGRIILACREPIAGLDRPSVRLDVHKPASHEQHAIWTSVLQPLGRPLNGEVDAVVGQFDLSTRSIEAAASLALATADTGGRDVARILWDASRTQARPRLDDLAQRIEPAATWDDLVLPEAQRQSLREMVVHARHRSRVYRDWGFVGKGLRGLGISALFCGPSGTGKTMAAEVLAGELRLDLYCIDLSSVVSKYIGETEKNLRRVFDAAEDGGTILLFDEADALFGKRSEVKDSHDRYANIEVGYLLQRMEAYRGIAILTTNLKSALDSAFLRRLRFIVSFPFPDPTARAEIWRRIFPAAAPVDGLQPEMLARLSITGGSIRNIALSAAFLAAETGESIGMSHLFRAARSEYAKLERPMTDAEIGGWS